MNRRQMVERWLADCKKRAEAEQSYAEAIQEELDNDLQPGWMTRLARKCPKHVRSNP